MSSNNNCGTANYDKISSKKYCCGGMNKGLRLYPRRFSVQRLRTKFLYLFGIFRRWKRSALRLLFRRNLHNNSSKRRKMDKDFVIIRNNNAYRSTVIRPMTHSNSFCSEAIADCLEFIKRNSVSTDDESKPMLPQD